MAKDKLSQKELNFCIEYFSNPRNQALAYCRAYGKDFTDPKAKASAYSSASRILKKDKIQKYLKELQKKAEGQAIATVSERKKKLTEIARFKINKDDDAKTINQVINAIDTLNKMDGTYKEQESKDIKITVSLDGAEVTEEDFEP